MIEALTGSPPVPVVVEETCCCWSFGFDDMSSENSKLREPWFASEIWASLGTLTWVSLSLLSQARVMIVVDCDQGAGKFPILVDFLTNLVHCSRRYCNALVSQTIQKSKSQGDWRKLRIVRCFVR